MTIFRKDTIMDRIKLVNPSKYVAGNVYQMAEDINSVVDFLIDVMVENGMLTKTTDEDANVWIEKVEH